MLFFFPDENRDLNGQNPEDEVKRIRNIHNHYNGDQLYANVSVRRIKSSTYLKCYKCT